MMGDYRSVGIKVEGLRQLRKTLREAGDDLSDLKALNKEAADIAARASAARAPVRSGKLKASIRSSGTKTAGIVRAGKKAVPYAGPIHWGWFKRNIKPQPFISNGAKDSEGQWLPIYEQGIDGIVRKVEGI